MRSAAQECAAGQGFNLTNEVMKHHCASIIVASALAISVVVMRQKAQAQNGSSRSSENVATSAPIFVTDIPSGYRDWKLISVAHEEGNLNDIRAILGNEIAIKAYREGDLPFPEGTIIARIAWSHDESQENNKSFTPFLKQGVQRSFVAGHPTNGVQFMVKDSKKYAATGGWGYAHFNNGKSADAGFMQSCYSCHRAIKSRDYVFGRYAP